MAVTETTTESWGSRLGNSIKGVIVGLGLFVLPALEVVSMPNVSGVASLAPLLSCPRLKTVTCAKKAFPEEEIATFEAALKARGKGNRVNAR